MWYGSRQTAHLLDVSVSGLPHVVILNDAGERLPWELRGQGDMMGGRTGQSRRVASAITSGLPLTAPGPQGSSNTAKPQQG